MSECIEWLLKMSTPHIRVVGSFLDHREKADDGSTNSVSSSRKKLCFLATGFNLPDFGGCGHLGSESAGRESVSLSFAFSHFCYASQIIINRFNKLQHTHSPSQPFENHFPSNSSLCNYILFLKNKR